jgi:polygalacturonase
VFVFSIVLLSAVSVSAADDPYWPQSIYNKIEKTILDNVPEVKDVNGQYIYETVDGVFTYSVKLTDFAPRKSIEDVFSARPSGTGSMLTRTEIDDWTWAFRAALQDVANHGGGTVVVPKGIYTTGAIRYRGDNTRIHLENGAEIRFIRNLQYGTNVRTEPTTMLPPVTPKEGEWDDWYPQEKTRYECRDLYGYSPLIYAYALKNIALTGAGNGGENSITGDGRNGTVDGSIIPEPGAPLSIINGMADSRHMRTFTATLPVYAADNTTVLAPTGTVMTHNINPATGQPILGTGGGSVNYSTWITNLMNAWMPIEDRKIPDLLPLDTPGLSDAQKASRNFRRVNQYRPTFIEPYECQNVLISDFYLNNSPFWELHPQYSQRVRISGLHINSHGGNNDGVDPDSSQYVLIEDCIFNTGDDCIAIKCGRDNDGYEPWNMPSTHMIIRNNMMKDGHGGMVAGSEMGGGVEWIFSHNNQYDSPNLYWGLRVKTNSSRGGYVRHIYLKDTVALALEGGLVKLNAYYDNDSDTRVPSFSDIYISNFSTPKEGFTSPPNLGFLVGKQYGSSPISGIHFKDCDFRGFRQSPDSAAHPNRPVNNVICVADGGIEYDNVLIDGELYQPPEKSSIINSLIFTKSSDPSDVRVISKPEDIEALINESRAAGSTGMNWDISIVAKVEGYEYKGKHYNISDTIANSTFVDTWAGSNHAYRNGMTANVDGPNIRYADTQFPYYRVNGMPAYEAFVRVNTNFPANDWYVTSGTWDGGPCYVVDLRMPNRVTPMKDVGDDVYLIKLRENVRMGTSQQLRPEVYTQNKVEVVLRNALYPEDQDFVFYSALPMITGTSIDAGKQLFKVGFDRPMNPKYLSDLEGLDFKVAADGTAVALEKTGVWSEDGKSISYKILETVDPDMYYTVDAFDPTSSVLSYRGQIPLTNYFRAATSETDITGDTAKTVAVTTELENYESAAKSCLVTLAVYNGKGQLVASDTKPVAVSVDAVVPVTNTVSGLTVGSGYTAKVYVWSDSYVPLVKPLLVGLDEG